MPANKLQHFVPRCHLRPFATGESLSLFNIGAGRIIKRASLGGQCAHNYFYGKDGSIERALQYWEGAYASIIKKISADPSTVDDADMHQLREFALLQHFRTFNIATKTVAASEKLYASLLEASGGNAMNVPKPLTLAAASMIALSAFLGGRTYVADLEMCLVVNQTISSFFTSDDPSILCNRYLTQRVGENSTGLVSSGVMLFLPLTPHLYFMAYDPNVYYVPGKTGRLLILREREAVAELNELQVLNAMHNLYFADGNQDQAEKDFKRFGGGRSNDWAQLQHFEMVESDGEGERYREMDSLRVMTEPMITTMQFTRVKPTRWTQLVKFRLRPKVVDTETGVGLVRPGHPVLAERFTRPFGERRPHRFSRK